MARILVVDDDVRMAEVLHALLAMRGHAVDTARDGESALMVALTDPPDLVILDLNLPGIDGERVLAELTRAGGSIPVIIVTGERTSATDEVRELRLGAVDYVRKGTSAEVLLERIEGVLRRPPPTTKKVVRVGRLEIDPALGTVTTDGTRRTHLASQSFRLVMYLANARRVVSKAEIASAIFGSDQHLFDHAVEQAIYQARRALGDSKLIRTVRGRGYELEQGT